MLHDNRLSLCDSRRGCQIQSTDACGKEISDVNIMSEREAHNGRGSPSLVGRGIANPMSERTRGFEIPRKEDEIPTPRAFFHR
jgi:hypothetical protein